MKIALIDADPLLYILGWICKDNPSIEEMLDGTARYVDEIVTLTGCDHYVGVFSHEENFRKSRYKYAPYKGNRPEKPEWFTEKAPYIQQFLLEQKKFIIAPSGLEADDVLAILGSTYKEDCVICSPDKDLLQVPGTHYNYQLKVDINESAALAEAAKWRTVSKEEAHERLWLQVLTGDMTDNVFGVPGLGPVKAAKLLQTAEDPILYPVTVCNAYRKYFGDYYGAVIFVETRDCIRLGTIPFPADYKVIPVPVERPEVIGIWEQLSR